MKPQHHTQTQASIGLYCIQLGPSSLRVLNYTGFRPQRSPHVFEINDIFSREFVPSPSWDELTKSKSCNQPCASFPRERRHGTRDEDARTAPRANTRTNDTKRIVRGPAKPRRAARSGQGFTQIFSCARRPPKLTYRM